MLEPKKWNEFRETGLMVFINTFLHIFGWCIVIDIENGTAFPARTDFEGFNELTQDEAYRKIKNHIKELP